MMEWITRMTGLELWISGAYRGSCTAPMQFTVSLSYHTNLLIRSPRSHHFVSNKKNGLRSSHFVQGDFFFSWKEPQVFLITLLSSLIKQGSQFPTTIIFSKEIFLLKRKMDRKRSLFRKERKERLERVRERKRENAKIMTKSIFFV